MTITMFTTDCPTHKIDVTMKNGERLWLTMVERAGPGMKKAIFRHHSGSEIPAIKSMGEWKEVDGFPSL